MKASWMRRRWYDFRLGHSVYLIFALTFSNFVLIFHRLLIERVDFLNEIFSELWLFILVFVVAYIPAAVFIGSFHRKTQIKVEFEQGLLNNPFIARNFRILIDLIQGNASKEEIDNFRNFLYKIEKKSDLFSDKETKG